MEYIKTPLRYIQYVIVLCLVYIKLNTWSRDNAQHCFMNCMSYISHPIIYYVRLYRLLRRSESPTCKLSVLQEEIQCSCQTPDIFLPHWMVLRPVVFRNNNMKPATSVQVVLFINPKLVLKNFS
jgi:hypothetical protein